LRTGGRLHHIGVGRTHAGTCVLLLIQDLHIRVIDAATGELLRELDLDPSQGLPAHRTAPRPEKKNTPDQMKVRGVLDVLRHHTGCPRQDSNLRTRLRRPHLRATLTCTNAPSRRSVGRTWGGGKQVAWAAVWP
jgi:hypothetical protein